MTLDWSESIDTLDWHELSALYKAAPLGNKNPADLQTAFTNSSFRCFVRDEGRLVGVGRALADCNGRDDGLPPRICPLADQEPAAAMLLISLNCLDLESKTFGVKLNTAKPIGRMRL